MVQHSLVNQTTLPKTQPFLKVMARPNDANPKGDMFGGWLMSQMDIAASLPAIERAQGHVVTVAVKDMRFLQPVFVNDLVSCYAQVSKVGNTSITVEVEVYAQRISLIDGKITAAKTADATFVFVAVSEPGVPRVVPK